MTTVLHSTSSPDSLDSFTQNAAGSIPAASAVCESTSGSVYQAETKLIVRENKETSSSIIPGLAASLLGTGAQTSVEDAYILTAYLHGSQFIDLAQREYLLLEFLMRSAGRVCGRMLIVEKVWDYDFDPGSNLVDVYIMRLREKIDSDHEVKLLHTVRGVGYVIKVP